MVGTKVASVGWFNHNNCGDEAFRVALKELFPNCIFTHYSNLLKNVDEINKADYLLIGGGNIVSHDFLKGLDKITVPYSFIGIGLVKDSPLELLAKAENVIVRDPNSLGLAKDKVPNAVCMPDITFSLKPNKEAGLKLLHNLAKLDPKKPTLGIFLNDCVSARFDSSILKFIEAEKAKLELSRFLESLNYNLVFVPMSCAPPDDRRISLDVIGKMAKGYKHSCVLVPLDPTECLNLISALDMSINMRLHSSIFCTINGIPFIDILHHDKSKGYLQSIDYADYGIDYYSLNLKTLHDTFMKLEQNKQGIKERLLVLAQKNNQQVRDTIANVHLLQER